MAEYLTPVGGYITPLDEELPTLPLSEVFGPVWQGEGPHTGKRCSFIRLGLCNLDCVWCDTPYTWDRKRFDLKAENPEVLVGDIAQEVYTHQTRMVVISGGEPLIHQAKQGWASLLELLYHEGLAIHVETNGTLVPNRTTLAYISHFTVSPKLDNSGVRYGKRVRPAALDAFGSLASSVSFKFVCESAADIGELRALLRRHQLEDRDIWVMPEGRSPSNVLANARILAPYVAAAGYNLTLRQQTLLYGSERGR
jgi:7-carboxy-7-deazaguanine synthase